MVFWGGLITTGMSGMKNLKEVTQFHPDYSVRIL